MNEKVQQIKNDPTDFGGTGNYPRSPGVKNKRLEIIPKQPLDSWAKIIYHHETEIEKALAEAENIPDIKLFNNSL